MKHRPSLFLVLPLLLLAMTLVGVRLWSGSGEVASAHVGTGTVHLEIDMVQDTGWCNTIDTSADHNLGDTYKVAICLSDADPVNNEVPKAFQFRLEYDDTLNTCVPVDCDTDPETEGTQGACRDSNPDANDGTSVFSNPDLGTGWNCNAADADPPQCDNDPATGAGHGSAYMSCYSTSAGTLPVGTTKSAPIALVTFKANSTTTGVDTLKLNLVAVYGAGGGFLYCDPPPADPGPCYGATDNKTRATTPTPTPIPTAPPVCDTWVERASMLTARGDHTSAVANDRIYAIGGWGGTRLASVEEYDPASDNWTPKSAMPAARAGLAAATVNNRIYAIGGENGTYVGTVEEYDPATDSWTSKADMPTPRVGHAAAALNGKIYVFGGESGGLSLTTVEEFDPATNTWSTKSPMPTARRWAAAAVIGNAIYVVGGCSVSCYYDGTGSLATVERYDPASDTWLTSAPMPTARWALAAATVNDKIYAIGGLGNHGVHYTTIEEYSPTADSWSVRSPMSRARQGHTANTVGGEIYVMGGHDQVPYGPYIGPVEEYTPPFAGDADCDGVPNAVDNCPSVDNPDQLNSDGGRRPNGPQISGEWASNPAQDKLGDACDPDNDNDRLPDSQEFDDHCPYRLVADTDGDRVLDGFEVATGFDPCNAVSKPLSQGGLDSDGDGLYDGTERGGYNTCAFTGDTYAGWATCVVPQDSDGDGCADMVEVLDLNGDRRANVGDTLLLAMRKIYPADGSTPPDTMSDGIFDINKDGRIDVGDQLLQAVNSCNVNGSQLGCPVCPAE